MGVGHGVVVQIEARIGRLADVHVDALVAGKGIGGERQQQGLLLGEGGAHADARVLGAGALGGQARAPGCGLGVQIGQIRVAPGGEEGIPGVANRPFNAPFLIPAGRGHRARLEPMMGGKGEQRGMETDGIALAFEHGALQVVVEQNPGNATEGGKGPGVAGQEAGHARIQEEAQVNLARVGEHHHEGHQGPAGTPDDQVPEVCPVDLCLFAGQRAQPQVGFGHPARPQHGHAVAKRAGAARVAALANHHVQAARGQCRESLQGCRDERHVGVDRAGAPRNHDAR